MFYIIPIISQSATGKVIPELGAGGGAGNLIQSHDLELEDLEDEDIAKLKALCIKKISDPEVRLKTLDIISQVIQSKPKVVSLDLLDLTRTRKTCLSRSLLSGLQSSTRTTSSARSLVQKRVMRGSRLQLVLLKKSRFQGKLQVS